MGRIQFKRFFSRARRYWDDGRHSGDPYVHQRGCYRAAADREGVDAAQFERLYVSCFADRPDPLDALNEAITGTLDALHDEAIHARLMGDAGIDRH